jgi:hypothetical protein
VEETGREGVVVMVLDGTFVDDMRIGGGMGGRELALPALPRSPARPLVERFAARKSGSSECAVGGQSSV